MNDHRIQVNEGWDTPLYLALKNVKNKENNYFYTVTQMLLSHIDIDVNEEAYHGGQHTRPLLFAIENIQEEKDNFFQLTEM